MTTILAAVDASAAAQPVLDVATAPGRTLRLPVVASTSARTAPRSSASSPSGPPSRAAVVREVLTRTPVPVILLPRPA